MLATDHCLLQYRNGRATRWNPLHGMTHDTHRVSGLGVAYATALLTNKPVGVAKLVRSGEPPSFPTYASDRVQQINGKQHQHNLTFIHEYPSDRLS